MAEADISNKGLAARVRELAQRDGQTISVDHVSVRRWLDGTRPKAATQNYIALALGAKLGRRVDLEEIGFNGGLQSVGPDATQHGSEYPANAGAAVDLMSQLTAADLEDQPALVRSQWAQDATPGIITGYMFSDSLHVVDADELRRGGDPCDGGKPDGPGLPLRRRTRPEDAALLLQIRDCSAAPGQPHRARTARPVQRSRGSRAVARLERVRRRPPRGQRSGTSFKDCGLRARLTTTSLVDGCSPTSATRRTTSAGSTTPSSSHARRRARRSARRHRLSRRCSSRRRLERWRATVRRASSPAWYGLREIPTHGERGTSTGAQGTPADLDHDRCCAGEREGHLLALLVLTSAECLV